MSLLADVVLDLANWVEIEFKAVRRGVLHTVVGSVFIVAGALVLSCGGALLLWALISVLTSRLNPGWALIVAGLAAVVVSAGLAWTARRAAR